MSTVRLKFPIPSISGLSKDTINISLSKRQSQFELLIDVSQKELVKTHKRQNNIAEKIHRRLLLQDQFNSQINNKCILKYKAGIQQLAKSKPLKSFDQEPSLEENKRFYFESQPISHKGDSIASHKQQSRNDIVYLKSNKVHNQLEDGDNTIESQSILKSTSEQKLKELVTPKSKFKDILSNRLSRINLKLPTYSKVSTQQQTQTNFDEEVSFKFQELDKKRPNVIEDSKPEQFKRVINGQQGSRNNRYYIDPILFPILVNNYHHSMPRIYEKNNVSPQPSQWKDNNYSSHIPTAKYISIEIEKSNQRNKVNQSEVSLSKEIRYRDVMDQASIEHYLKVSAKALDKTNIQQRQAKEEKRKSRLFYGDKICSEIYIPDKKKKKKPSIPGQHGFQDLTQIQDLEDYFYSYVKSQKQ